MRMTARSRKIAGSAVMAGGGPGPVGARRSGLHDGDDEPDRREDVADAAALGLGADLDHGLAGVVHLPGELPPFGLAARDGLLELADDLLERVALAVVQH